MKGVLDVELPGFVRVGSRYPSICQTVPFAEFRRPAPAVKVGLGTASTPPRARMKARAKLVLPAPSSPLRAITSPGRASAAMRAAKAAVAASSGSSMTIIAYGLYILRRSRNILLADDL